MCSTAATGLPVASMTMSISGFETSFCQSSVIEVAEMAAGLQPTRSRFALAFAGARSAIATSRMPGVRGTCARYMAANLPGADEPDAEGSVLRFSFLQFRK